MIGAGPQGRGLGSHGLDQQLPGAAVARSETRKIASVEALRGAAASAVVLSHAARHVNRVLGDPWLVDWFQAGHAGVDLFFVISGFIILHVHRHDIGRTRRLAPYLLRRVTRVVPMYWLALAATIAIGAIGSGRIPAPRDLLSSMFLIPTVREPILGIAWTLQFEVVFYVMFAALIVERRAGLVLFGLWLGWIVTAVMGVSNLLDVPPALWGSFCVEFFLGMAAAQALHLAIIPAPRLWAMLGLGMFAAALVLESQGVFDGFGSFARFCYGVPATILVAGCASAERRGTLAVPGWLRALGGASYSLYLFQFIMIGIAWQIFLVTGLSRHLPKEVIFACLVASALAGGMLIARFVERPLLRVMRRSA